MRVEPRPGQSDLSHSQQRVLPFERINSFTMAKVRPDRSACLPRPAFGTIAHIELLYSISGMLPAAHSTAVSYFPLHLTN